MENTHVASIVTDENAWKLMLWLVGILGTTTLSLFAWGIKKIYSELKAGKSQTVDLVQEIRGEMVDFTNELKYKFRTLNNYAKEHERTSILHSEKISNLNLQTQDYKKKTDEHSNILTRHETEIDFLKRKG